MHTKSELSSFTCSEDISEGPEFEIRDDFWWLGLLKVIGSVTI